MVVIVFPFWRVMSAILSIREAFLRLFSIDLFFTYQKKNKKIKLERPSWDGMTFLWVKNEERYDLLRNRRLFENEEQSN